MSQLPLESPSMCITDQAALPDIDACIQHFSTLNDITEINGTLIELAGFICSYLGAPCPDNHWNSLFSHEATPHQRQFIAVCLLRAIRNNNQVPELREFYIKTHILFDDVFRDNLYKYAKIDPKNQNIQKENQLIELLTQTETQILDLISSASTIPDLLELRQDFMKRFNSPSAKTLIHPFIPHSLTDIKLKRFFEHITSYTTAQATDIIREYHSSAEFINEFLESADRLETEYSRLFLKELLVKTTKMLAADFRSNPIGKPGIIEIRKGNKKHPLHSSGETFNLTFNLTNIGEGSAFNTTYTISNATDNIAIIERQKQVGLIDPSQSLLIEVPCRVSKPDDFAILEGSVSWENADGLLQEKVLELEISPQRSDIDWEALSIRYPYSLEPVSNDSDLVGRVETLDQLVAKARNRVMGSSFLYGQKRVGKTSIALALQAKLKKIDQGTYVVVYLEVGHFIDLMPEHTIENLGRNLCKAIMKSDERFAQLVIPNFYGALSPFNEFLDQATQCAPDKKFLFMLDEFDELPLVFFKSDSTIGNPLFLTIRTISNQPHFSFLLIGGEGMEYVKSNMGGHLNKFESLRVDYFDKENHWNDFVDLVKTPITQWFDINDDAINEIYYWTSGNPYFTNIICAHLYRMMVRKRDSHITSADVSESVTIALCKIDSNSVQHFWEGGISNTGLSREDASLKRRKILLAIGEVARADGPLTVDKIATVGQKYELDKSTVELGLREFIRRQVLVPKADSFCFKVPLFQEWLKSSGLDVVLSTITDHSGITAEARQEVQAAIKPEEVISLAKKWGVYQGRRISPDEIRAWLNQFQDNRTQRLIWPILEGLRFYSDGLIREKLKEAHGIVKRGVVHEIDGRKQKRDDIVISYLDGPGKSGAQCAKLYADENKIYSRMVIEKSKLGDILKENSQGIKAVVFVDDLLATGDSAIGDLSSLLGEHSELLQSKSVYLITVCGFIHAQEKVTSFLEDNGYSADVHICDMLDEKDMCFSDNSTIYPAEAGRAKAKRVVEEIGKTLTMAKTMPLGYGNTQSTIVFEHNCPDNSLPILWATNDRWVPLFDRQM